MNAEGKERPSYYTVILATVRYDARLTFFERVLYSDLLAMSCQNGFAFPSNSYLAELYKQDKSTVKRALKALKDHGYISITVDQEKGNKRHIFINPLPSERFLDPLGSKMSPPGGKNEPTLGSTVSPPGGKNEPYNNIGITKENNIPNKNEPSTLNGYYSNYKNKATGRKNNAPDVKIDWFETYLKELDITEDKKLEIKAALDE